MTLALPIKAQISDRRDKATGKALALQEPTIIRIYGITYSFPNTARGNSKAQGQEEPLNTTSNCPQIVIKIM